MNSRELDFKKVKLPKRTKGSRVEVTVFGVLGHAKASIAGGDQAG